MVTSIVLANGAAGGVPKVTERQVTRIVNVELVDIKDLKITTAGGKDVELKDAMEKLKGGGIAVMTNDGKPVSIQYLRILKDDILVLSSPELIGTGAVTGPSTGIGGFKPLPLPAADPTR